MKAGDEWSIAHPLDFVSAGDWHEWQAECFRHGRLQPFKQVFREVYVLTPAEKEDGDKSRRYSGQQVNENQAKALFGARGWSTRDDISKLYRDANLVVEILVRPRLHHPGDAASPAVARLVFHRRGDWKLLPLTDVPPIIFSEVMRDLDLVVSVAHVGGVDPEATQSTVADAGGPAARNVQAPEAGQREVREPARADPGRVRPLFGPPGQRRGPQAARRRRCASCRSNAQHRGRLFLPFADDDPRTAEVISKVLLLARDKEIQDPTILQQIVGK